MSGFSRVVIHGYMTRDPEVRFSASGVAVVKFGVAMNRKRSKDEEPRPIFVDVTMLGKRGEAFAKYHSKGKAVLVEGELEMDSWEDKQSGQKRSKLYVLASGWEFVLGGKRDEDGEGAEEPAGEAPAADDRAF